MTKTYQSLMDAEAKRTKLAGQNPAGPGHDEIERVRSILFGGLPDQLEEAIQRLGAKLEEQASGFRADLDGIQQKLDKRLAEIDSRSNQSRNELRDQILSQSRLLTDSIQERSEQAMQASKRGVNELSASKLDRTEFAAFLRQTAEHFAQAGPVADARDELEHDESDIEAAA